MAYPTAPEINAPPDLESREIFIRRRQRGGQLGAQLGRQSFVGVQAHYPWRRDWQMIERPIELACMAPPGIGVHPSPGTLRDLDRAVGASRVDYIDLRRELLQAFKGKGQILLFIFGQNDNGKQLCAVL